MNLNDWCCLIYDFGFEKVISHLLPLSIRSSICWLVQEVEMLVYWLRLGAVQAEQNLWFSIRMKWSWSTFWWVKIMRGWPGQSVRWRCWGEKGRGARGEKGSVEKGVAERKGHRVIDGPHTDHDVWNEVLAESEQGQLKATYCCKGFNASLKWKCLCVDKSQMGQRSV